ncbi:MAG: phosphatidylcholine synthase [Pseudorhodoplanes sp.]|nr:phosphatidylcholine synthase [Pseudorhodoplanes sp.]GIK82347.1 MAG: phosphatidylcholine synthase [Alphaproteobacteria bacterium]
MARKARAARKGDRPAASNVARDKAPATARAAAFGVHVFTALGAACALMALLAAVRSDWVAMFGWFGVAMVIDGADGALARRLDVAATLPHWSGEALDLMVDYTTYVFVPAYALAASSVLPAAFALPLAVAIAISGALYCADRRMKTADNYFIGFPVLWNAAAFHLFVAGLPPAGAAILVVVLLVLTFVPYRTVHPLRVKRLFALNVVVVALWSALAVYALFCNLMPGVPVVVALSLAAVYLLGIGIVPARR